MQPVTTVHTDTLQKLNRAQITKYLLHMALKLTINVTSNAKLKHFIIFLDHVKFFFKEKNPSLTLVTVHKTLHWILFLSF